MFAICTQFSTGADKLERRVKSGYVKGCIQELFERIKDCIRAYSYKKIFILSGMENSWFMTSMPASSVLELWALLPDKEQLSRTTTYGHRIFLHPLTATTTTTTIITTICCIVSKTRNASVSTSNSLTSNNNLYVNYSWF